MAKKNQSFRYNGTVLYYTAHADRATITGGSGIDSLLELPEEIDGLPVKKVAKKAFVGLSDLIKVVFPASVRKIESWALAQCRSLQTVVIKNPRIVLESGVFEDCTSIKAICLGEDRVDDQAVLMGTLPVRLHTEHLMTAPDLGSREWFDRWDKKLLSFLQEDDQEGYTTLVLCGEEDIMRSVPGYVRDRRVEKAALCMLRLRHSQYLDEDNKQILIEYIRSHSKGCESDEAWQALLTHFGDELPYYEMFTKLCSITKENLDAMLVDMGEEHAEAKAYLMKYHAEHFGTVDVFDAFTL